MELSRSWPRNVVSEGDSIILDVYSKESKTQDKQCFFFKSLQQELRELKADLKMDFKALQKAGLLGVVTCRTENIPEAGLRPSGDQVQPYLALGAQGFMGPCFARSGCMLLSPSHPQL